MIMKPRTIEILCAIKYRCEPGESGHYESGSFWVGNGLGRGCDDWSEEHRKFINISGSGDCAILVALERNGLTKKPCSDLGYKHLYRITEAGVLAIENNRNLIPSQMDDLDSDGDFGD